MVKIIIITLSLLLCNNLIAQKYNWDTPANEAEFRASLAEKIEIFDSLKYKTGKLDNIRYKEALEHCIRLTDYYENNKFIIVNKYYYAWGEIEEEWASILLRQYSLIRLETYLKLPKDNRLLFDPNLVKTLKAKQWEAYNAISAAMPKSQDSLDLAKYLVAEEKYKEAISFYTAKKRLLIESFQEFYEADSLLKNRFIALEYNKKRYYPIVSDTCKTVNYRIFISIWEGEKENFRDFTQNIIILDSLETLISTSTKKQAKKTQKTISKIQKQQDLFLLSFTMDSLIYNIDVDFCRAHRCRQDTTEMYYWSMENVKTTISNSSKNTKYQDSISLINKGRITTTNNLELFLTLENANDKYKFSIPIMVLLRVNYDVASGKIGTISLIPEKNQVDYMSATKGTKGLIVKIWVDDAMSQTKFKESIQKL
jgi:hypothetical protein